MSQFKISNDLHYAGILEGFVSLYLDLLETTVVFCVDDIGLYPNRSTAEQCRAISMACGYKRYSASTLFVALNVLRSEVLVSAKNDIGIKSCWRSRIPLVSRYRSPNPLCGKNQWM